MLAEMVIPIDGYSTEVAHLGPAAARHAVAAFGFDEARPTFMAFSNASSSHFLFTEKRTHDWRHQGRRRRKKNMAIPYACLALLVTFKREKSPCFGPENWVLLISC